MDVIQDLFTILTKDYAHSIGAVIVAVLAICFTWHVLIQGVRQWLRLGALSRRISGVGERPHAEQLDALRSAFVDARLGKPWQEFQETLHEKVSPGGATEIRATALAEAFFNVETLVDGPLHAEFYKHLPGILTGIGIIATFSGLIAGLAAFDPTSPDAASQLGPLFEAVQGAFLVSAFAIGLAMLFTMIEKVIYATCVARATSVAQELDHLFQSGVGEEYLATLTQSAQESASQARQLKEAIVGDLREILTNLTNEQIRAYREVADSQTAASREASANLEKSIQESLQRPLEQIANTVRISTEGQSRQSGEILERLMGTFVEHMKGAVGGQMEGLTRLIESSSATMSRVEASLSVLADALQANAHQANEANADALKTITTTLGDFLTKQQVAQSQLQQDVQERIAQALQRFTKLQDDALKATQQATMDVTSRIAATTDAAIKASDHARDESQRAVSQLMASSSELLQRWRDAAEVLSGATSETSTAATRLSQVAGVLDQLHARAKDSLEAQARTSTQLAQASQSLSTVGATVGHATERLELTAGRLATEAEVRTAMLNSIRESLAASERIAQSFQALSASMEAQQSESFHRFGKGVIEVVDKNLKAFDDELGQAVRLLSAVIGELTDKAEAIDESAEQMLKALRRA